MDVVGYTDRLSAAPGETVALMASSESAAVDVALVRLIHADKHPDGPGYKAEPVASPIAGSHPARSQELPLGSCVRIPDAPQLRCGDALTLQLGVWPTRGGHGAQVLAAKADASGRGWTLELTAGGTIAFHVMDADGRVASVETDGAVRDRCWYAATATFDGGADALTLHVEPVQPAGGMIPPRVLGDEPLSATAPLGRTPAVPEADLLLAAAPRADGAAGRVERCFNGKLARPRLLSRAIDADERASLWAGAAVADLIAAWDFSQGPATRAALDTGPHELHGRTVQMPTRGVTGPDWGHLASGHREAPQEYDAIAFHEDDLDDAGWEPLLQWTVPEDLRSGVYAFHLRTPAGEDVVPIFVTAPRDRATARVLFLAPTFSYLAYANEHNLERPLFQEIFGIEEWPTDPEHKYILAQRLGGIYDRHPDGSGITTSSWLRPVMNLRPSYHMGLLAGAKGGAHQFSADLHLVDWLEHEGIAYDVATDLELQLQGAELLKRYDVVLTGSHAEYWSGPMLDGLARYTDAGGRVMYMGGNGLYWVTGFDPDEQHTVEVRRTNGTTPWEPEPGEAHLATTGEPGGIWRVRGLAPQRYVGTGFAGQTQGGLGGAFVRSEVAGEERFAFVFDGVEHDGPIGGFPNLTSGAGAAGIEIDSADVRLGTPPRAHRLASATAEELDGAWMTAREECEPDLRCDLLLYETPEGGAVFSVSSMAWCAALSYDGYRNDVARITANVVQRFLDDRPLAL